jgi:hypothetical protein
VTTNDLQEMPRTMRILNEARDQIRHRLAIYRQAHIDGWEPAPMPADYIPPRRTIKADD